MPNTTMKCSSCKNTVNGNFCSSCGQPTQLKRIDQHYVLHEIQHILHFEKGIPYTIKELLIAPGKNVKEFLKENRSRLVKPILFLVLSSLMYTIINNVFHIEQGYVDFKEEKHTALGSIFSWIQNHYGYANILMGVFISAWIKVFYKKYDYNFFEVLILQCFILGISMLVISLFALLEGLLQVNLMQISGIFSVAYCIWGTGQFFDKSSVASYLKALICYLLGMITFLTLAIMLGLFIDAL
ncbi:DUF3667 domain-containing protein [Pedobacter insulae]|uniref:DUF3667 domain-containing protein n=1 Tax=Pedobacter insulae TaxID=414048 RepID=A0A1I2YCE9_9SPHI|nr:DUF3667 domain-containing protein [Pedobacter insulae]SFH23353.1 Protein of unknown function [Pedobacter insulae]